MEFLTQQNLVRVPVDRVQNLILTIKKIMSAKHVSARTFLSLLGKLSAAADLVLLGRLHLRPLQMCLLSVWKPHILPLDHPISINGMIRSHLQWWINPIRFETGTSIHPPDPKFFLYTDASHYGWGAHLEPTTLSFHGRWTENQSHLHINMLEMMAIRLAMKQAKAFIHHSCIMISTDNTTVARPAILVVGKGRGRMFLFLLFLHFHSCSSFFPVPLFHLLYSLFYLFSLSLGDSTK